MRRQIQAVLLASLVLASFFSGVLVVYAVTSCATAPSFGAKGVGLPCFTGGNPSPLPAKGTLFYRGDLGTVMFSNGTRAFPFVAEFSVNYTGDGASCSDSPCHVVTLPFTPSQYAIMVKNGTTDEFAFVEGGTNIAAAIGPGFQFTDAFCNGLGNFHYIVDHGADVGAVGSCLNQGNTAGAEYTLFAWSGQG